MRMRLICADQAEECATNPVQRIFSNKVTDLRPGNTDKKSVLLSRKSFTFCQGFPRKAMRRRDAPPGRLYKFAGLLEITNLVATSPPKVDPSHPRESVCDGEYR